MIKSSLLLVVLLYICASCGDFLEPKSKGEYVPEDVASLNEMLIGAAYPRAEASRPLNSGLILLDDDVSCNPAVTSYGSDANKVEGCRNYYTWQPDMFEKMKDAGSGFSWVPMSNSIWAEYYNLILGANAALDYVDDMEGSEEDKNVVKAQAYALRGFMYFNLVNIFGEPYNYNKKALGVPLKLNSGVEATPLPRNTVEEVYAQVLSDLGEAERCYLTLSEELQYSKGYRTNLPMVQLLKSRVYLYMENWKDAAIYANRIIEDWDFALVDLNFIATPASYKFISLDCPEIIWTFGSTIDIMNYVGGSRFPTEGSSQNLFVASPDLIKGYKTGDQRRTVYILTNYTGVNLPFSKYGTTSPSAPSNSQGLRLPEAYLNLAEAAAMDKDETTALRALNTLREKRFTPEEYKEIKGISGKELLDTIRQERRLELCLELHRWFDLRRYGMPSISKLWNVNGKMQTYTLEEKDKGYTLPIPRMIMDQNKVLIQNELASTRKPE